MKILCLINADSLTTAYYFSVRNKEKTDSSSTHICPSILVQSERAAAHTRGYLQFSIWALVCSHSLNCPWCPFTCFSELLTTKIAGWSLMCWWAQLTILSCISLLWGPSRNCSPAVVIPYVDNVRKVCQLNDFPTLKTSGVVFFFSHTILIDNSSFRKYRNKNK